MSVITQKTMLEALVRNVINEYITHNQMFTVYQIWSDACFVNGSKLDYNFVRNVVENCVYIGWTRTVGDHLKNLDNTVGNIGASPQIYHPLNANVRQYDPRFRLHNSKPTPNVVAVQVVQPTSKSKKSSGLFRFNVWFNGKLVPCGLRQVRGAGGKFVKNRDYEGYGVLDDGSPVVVKQDNDGKLYAVQGV